MLNKSFSSRPKYIIQAKERFFWQSAKNLAGAVVSPVQLAQPSVDCPMRVLLYSTLHSRRSTRQWNYFWEPERDKPEARSSSSLLLLKTLMFSSRRRGFLHSILSVNLTSF